MSRMAGYELSTLHVRDVMSLCFAPNLVFFHLLLSRSSDKVKPRIHGTRIRLGLHVFVFKVGHAIMALVYRIFLYPSSLSLFNGSFLDIE